MPYYTWRGIDLEASYRKGRLYATNIAELERLLLRRHLALTRASVARTAIPVPVSKSQIILFFKQLGVLLRSGILLPEALAIIAEQTMHVRLQSTIQGIAQQVSQGKSLSAVLQEYPKLFGTVMISMVRTGEASGCLADAIDALVVYLEMAATFGKKIVSAALMPLCTLGASLMLSAGVLVFIVPRFAQLFHSMGRELPGITQWLLFVSDLLQRLDVWMMMGAAVVVCAIIAKVLQKKIKSYLHNWVLRVPLINAIVIETAILYWLQALAMLLHKRVPLVAALHITNRLVHNEQLFKALSAIPDEVSSGNSLRFAMINAEYQPFGNDLLALVQIGQESGDLASMVEKAAVIYKEKVERKLHLITVVIQPLLLVIMGLFVAFLVFSLYMPVFNMAHIG